MTRIVAWNVCGGGGKRVPAITSALTSLDPSIVVLSEVTEPRLDEWMVALAGLGLTHQTHTVASVTETDPYGLIVATSRPQEAEPWVQPSPFPNRTVRVRVDGLSVTGIHAPDQPKPAAPFYAWLLAASPPPPDTDAVLVGDFNADLDGEGIALARYFAPLVDSGWTHGLRHLHPNGDHTSWWGHHRGFAIDHCLVSPALVPSLNRAEILAAIGGVPTAGPGLHMSDGTLSDHRPLLVDLVAPPR